MLRRNYFLIPRLQSYKIISMRLESHKYSTRGSSTTATDPVSLGVQHSASESLPRLRWIRMNANK